MVCVNYQSCMINVLVNRNWYYLKISDIIFYPKLDFSYNALFMTKWIYLPIYSDNSLF